MAPVPPAGRCHLGHGLLGFPGSYGAVVLFEVSTARPPSESGSSDGSLPSAHSVFGSEEEEEMEVEVEVEEDDQEFEEVEVEEEDAEEEEIVVEDWLFDCCELATAASSEGTPQSMNNNGAEVYQVLDANQWFVRENRHLATTCVQAR